MADNHDGVLRHRRRMLGDRDLTRSAVPTQRVASQTAQLTNAQRMARKAKRSADLLRALQQLDTAPSPQAQQEIVDWLQQVYEARGGGPLIGLFGHCYLGHPYVDHAFDLSGGAIREHYAADAPVPAIYAGARPFARSDAYRYIEIYADGQIIPIRPDGSPTA